MSSIEELSLNLRSEDLSVRMKVLPASRSLSHADRFVLIKIAVNDPNSRIRYDAVSQLATLGREDLETTKAILKEILHHDPEMDVRAASADTIAALGLVEFFDDLQQIYETTSDWLMQFSVVAALGELGEPRAYDLLVKALEHSNELVRLAAIGSLGELGNPQALELLAPLAQHPDWQVRHRVAQALANFGAPALPILQQLQSDPNANVAELAQRLCSP